VWEQREGNRESDRSVSKTYRELPIGNEGSPGTMYLLTLVVALVGVTPEAPAELTEPPFQEPIEGTWMGSIEAAGIRLVFNISVGDDGLLTSTMDSPDQGATGIPTGETTFQDGTLLITVPAVPGGQYQGTLQEDGTIAGSWSQSGQSFPLVLERQEGELPALERPQEPQAPFPYSTEDVSYANPAAGNELAGTLTLPEGAGPFPAVVMISGSGPQDRNEELLGHKPFWVIADYFTRQGIAVLRFDDRGVGESTGAFSGATSADFATDVEAGVDYLSTRAEIDHARIGLVGHSEGGLIAPMVAVNRDDVAFIVLMAGPGTSGAEILYDQAALILEAGGVSAEVVQKNTARQRRMFEFLFSVDDQEDGATVAEGFKSLLLAEVANMSDAEKSATGLSDDEQAIETAVSQFTAPWFRFFLAYDPAPALERVSVPVLAINGELDLQVPPDTNLDAIEAALQRGGNADFTTRKLDGLNHLFQTATTGAPSEYRAIEETISPVALDLMTTWILDHVR
jgi:uncharacterized protein